MWKASAWDSISEEYKFFGVRAFLLEIDEHRLLKSCIGHYLGEMQTLEVSDGKGFERLKFVKEPCARRYIGMWISG